MALNPITFTERVVEDFLHYQLTTYPLADPDLYGQLRKLLELEETRKTPLRRGPFVSLSQPFKQGAAVQQLIDEGIFHPAMASVVAYPQLRAHQEAAIRSVHRGDTTLVSTGTGSGKTETFLYPVISRCLELKAHQAPPGIVAVLVYPMNALAEDQLDRLRGLLAGRGISFGMYVGKTPNEESQVQGERMPPGSSNAAYRARLKQLRSAGMATTLIPHEERADRKALRNNPPRILLTNVKQLELLLTRGKDIGMFENAPLEFLVLDEAHTFRGAQGAETACLIRRLRTFCGRRPDEVRHVATSATMADPEGGDAAARDFARRFFGVDGQRVTLVRELHDELRWNERRSVPVGPPEEPAQVLMELLRAIDAPDAEVADSISAQLIRLGGARLRRENWQDALSSQLASNDLVYQLARILVKPKALAAIPGLLEASAGRPVPMEEILCWLALGAATGRGNHDPLLRPVVHSFVRGVGGAVVTFSNENASARLWLAGEDAAAELGDSHKRFPVITCTICGQHYYENWVQGLELKAGASTGASGGDLHGSLRVWEHVPEETGGGRILFVDRLVVVPDEDEGVEEQDEDGELRTPFSSEQAEERVRGVEEQDEDGELRTPEGHDFDHKRLHPMFVCHHCGSIQEKNSFSCTACNAQQALVPVQVVRQKPDRPELLSSCVSCDSPARRPRGGNLREPARPVRAVGVSDVHVLAQSMMHLSERPRLLVFADNRQDAAFQAGWMTDHARRFRLRALMSQQIRAAGVSIGDVVYNLDKVLEDDRDLSRALVPEVWQVIPFDESGVKHREERIYFLRMQLLREVATGVKQRLGLEPWGRLKVTYTGLNQSLPFFQEWAPLLDVSPEALTEGVAALLDHLRRIRMLSDPCLLFEKYWGGGDKETMYGYVPAFPGGPKALKLSRSEQDTAARVVQWIGTRPTQVWNAAASWGVPEKKLEAFLEDLWETLVAAEILKPVSLMGWWKKPLSGCVNGYQIDSGTLLLAPHSGRLRCEKCRRTTIRQGPTGLCMAWRCGGRLVKEGEDQDDFNLRLLDGDYSMLRVAEHSAQVPHALRERIENQFKGEGEQLNTLVCTPTLELGVDIGALDAVLMRNVPPSAANYWQRAGRAGRRHRMAVDITYAQSTGFDQAYFREPLKLLEGLVEPPRFNLKNEVMVRKHVHATVLTTLHGLSKRVDAESQQRISLVLARCFPTFLNSYLFTPGGEVMDKVLDVSPLGDLIRAYRPELLAALDRAFRSSWPDEDQEAVSETLLSHFLDTMPDQLAMVLARLKRRLDWALGELRRLSVIKLKQGTLTPDDKAHERRCEKVISRLKSTFKRDRATAQGGSSDSETMGALAREGFLPGYGLESGSIVGTAEPPRMTTGLSDFELPRAPSMALREYVPGNAIYANGFRFVPRRFQLTPEETLRFRVLVEQQVVQEVGTESAQALLAEQEIRAVPVCDAILPSQSQISDNEEFRFQMPVATYGNDRGYHRGGTAWTWGSLDIRFRRGVQLRMVNVGPRNEVEQTRLGFPLCLACGQSHSPFASKKSREAFEKFHLERCGHTIKPTGFYADIEVDVLGLHDVKERKAGFSVVEALRVGAARVLDMEVEDLQLLALGRVGEDSCDVFLYDPMPGGSGLLEQLAQRWEEVCVAALDLLHNCPGACETSCIDCLRTYRNRFYHEFLDRQVASQVLNAASGPLVHSYLIPEHLQKTQSTAGQAQTQIEFRFKQLLSAAGLPSPTCQKPIELGAGYGGTIPDFFYDGEDEDEPGICIYLDGMAGHIHGNQEQAEKDRVIRAKLDSLGYEVVVVRSFELDNKKAMVAAIARIAKYLVGKPKQKALKADTSWFEEAVLESSATGGDAAGSETSTISVARKESSRPHLILVQPTAEQRFVTCLPLVDLKVAAGSFSDVQDVLDNGTDWVALDGAGSVKPAQDLFVAQVVGESMNRRIPNGAYCVWRRNPSGPFDGKVVLAQHRDIADPETGGKYTVKVYESDKEPNEEGTLQTAVVRLKPDSTEPGFAPIVLRDPEDASLTIVAVFLRTL